MFCSTLPVLVEAALCFCQLDRDALYRHLETAEDADAARAQLADRGLAAFVADAAVLPRASGIDPRPLNRGQAVPFGRDTDAFSTEDASGSTSQAANIIEALELEARVLLIDEDTSATNFMIRDHRMQELVAKEREPITPFIDKVRQLQTERGVSTVLVIGGSGDYFDVADTVLCMVDYLPQEVTAQATAISRKYAAKRHSEGGRRFGHVSPRSPLASSLDAAKGRRPLNIAARGVGALSFGRQQIDLGAVEQLVDVSQTRAIGQAMQYARRHMDGVRSLGEVAAALEADLAAHGLQVLDARPVGDLAAFRRFEFAAAVNRLRSLRVASGERPAAEC